MRKLARGFTMRKDRKLPGGDWFNFVNEGDKPKIYIYDEIGFWGTEASEFVKELNKLEDPVIELHLNSPGGEVFDGLAIFNSLKQHKSEIHVFVDGLAASAASFIAQAGDKVIMSRNAEMMIHDGIAFAYGNEQDMLDTARVLSNLSNNIADIYAQAAKRRGFTDTSEASFRGLMREEVWYNGRETVDAGLADEVTDTADDEAEEATNKWDLTFYNSAGRANAESPLRVRQRVLLNLQKENDMAQGAAEPQATHLDPETTQPATPEGTPQEPVEQPAPEEAPEPTPAPAEPASPGSPPANLAGGFQGVVIDGQMVTDPQAIQNFINVSVQAQVEQKAAHRKAFLEGLAASNKIPAPQVDSLVALVNGDGDKIPAMSDEQFDAFKASYESSTAIGLFENHATDQTPGGTGPGDARAAVGTSEDRRSILEGIVAINRRTMSEEDLEKTPSFVELAQLNNKSNES